MNKALVREMPLPADAKPFVHLHVHSAYSLLEGALPLKKVIEMAVEDNQPALAITDRSNLFGALEYSEKACAEGLQPIIGCTLEIAFEKAQEVDEEKQFTKAASSQEAMQPLPKLVLLASTADGYANLMKIVSMAYLDGEITSRTHLSLEQLKDHSNGIIVLTGGPEGPLNLALGLGQNEMVSERLTKLQEIF